MSPRRHVRHRRERSTANVRLASPRSSSLEGGRTLLLVAPAVDVPVSTGSSTTRSTGSHRSGSVRRHSHRSSLAKPDLVHSSASSVGRSSSQSADLPHSSQADRIKPVPPQSGDAPSSRLASLRTSLEGKGYSSDVARRISTAHKDSTSAIYDSRWKIYCSWCDDQGIDPLSASTPDIADFLTHRFTTKEAAYNTLSGYKTVIVNTIKEATGRVLPDEHHLSSLLSQFAIERPRSHNLAPPWDLSLVLRALHYWPFEPLARAELWALTFKTVFLTAFATAKRRGELHAFLHRIQRTENWSQITLVPDPVFIAKTEKPGRPETRLQSVTLKSLGAFVGPDLPVDANNCVVRAIKIYLSRTAAYRRGRKRLFISYKQSMHDEIKPATISSWIIKTVRYAYDNASEDTAQLFKVRAHDLRAMSTSWGAHKNLRIADVLQAAQWRSQSTFTSFYLLDMSVLEEEMYKLGPVVASQAICLPASSSS